MLKRLTVLTVLVAGFVYPARPQVPRDGSKQDRPTQKKADTAKPVQPLSATFQKYPATAQHEKSSKEKPSYYPWKELLAPANIPNWMLCLVGGVAGGAAVLTLRTIKRQADIMKQQADDARAATTEAREAANQATAIALATAEAAKRNADATFAQIQVMKEQALVMDHQTSILKTSVAIAQKSADAFVNSERARLAIIFTEVEPSIFKFYAKNSGRSPALLMFATVRFHILPAEKVMPWTPDYLDEDESWSGDEEWILPNQSAELNINDILERLDLSQDSISFDEQIWQDLTAKKSRSWFYGYVRYRESVSGEDKITRFRYECIWTDEDFFLLRDGNGHYNLET